MIALFHASTLIKKGRSTVDIGIQSLLNALKNNPASFNSNNNNNNNNNSLLPPPPLPFHPQQPPTFRPPPTVPINFQPAFRLSPLASINFPLTPPPAQNNLNVNFSKTTTAITSFGELMAEKARNNYKKQET